MELSTHRIATPVSAKTAIHMDANPKRPSIMTKNFYDQAKITFCQEMRLVALAMDNAWGTAPWKNS